VAAVILAEVLLMRLPSRAFGKRESGGGIVTGRKHFIGSAGEGFLY